MKLEWKDKPQAAAPNKEASEEKVAAKEEKADVQEPQATDE